MNNSGVLEMILNCNILGSLLVAVVTLIGTYCIQRVNNLKNYKSEYRKNLINKKLRAIEDLYRYLQNFHVLTYDRRAFPWMLESEKTRSIVNELYNINNELIWFPIDLKNKISELSIILTNYTKFIVDCEIKNIKYDTNYITQQLQTTRNKILKKSSSIEIKLYEYLIDEDSLIEVLKKNIYEIRNSNLVKGLSENTNKTKSR